MWIAVPVFLITFPFVRIPLSFGGNKGITSVSSTVSSLISSKDEYTTTETDNTITDSDTINMDADKKTSNTTIQSTDTTKSDATIKLTNDSTSDTSDKTKDAYTHNFAIKSDDELTNDTTKSDAALTGDTITKASDFLTDNTSARSSDSLTDNTTTNAADTVTSDTTQKSADAATDDKSEIKANNKSAVKSSSAEKIIKVIIFSVYTGIVSIFLIMLFAVNMKYIASCKKKRKFLFCTDKTNLHVYHLDGISSPFIMGKTIYLPSFMTDDEQIKYAVLHEEGHYKHGDSLWVIVRFVVLAIFFFNPLIWMAFFASGRDCELACDEEVLNQIRSDERKQYGACLLGIIKKRQSMTGNMILSTGMSAGKKTMKERIENIMNINKKSRFAMTLTIALMIVITGCSYKSDHKNGFDANSQKENSSSDTTNDNDSNSQEDAATDKETDSKNTKEINNKNDTTIKENNNENDTGELTKHEKETLENWANDIRNNGFLLTSYDDPKDADYETVFFGGADVGYKDEIPNEITSKQVLDDYTELANPIGFPESIRIFKKKDINDFLNKKVGLSIDDIDFSCYIYSPTYDVYYDMQTETNYTPFICTDGKKSVDDNGNEIYTATFAPEFLPDKTATATFKKTGEDYIIQSCKSDILKKDDTINVAGISSKLINDTFTNSDCRKLTLEEMKSLSKWAQDEGNYGFLYSTYDNPKDADYSNVFYTGAGMDVTQDLYDKYTYEKIEQEFLDLKGWPELYEGFVALRRQDIIDYLKDKVNLNPDDIDYKFGLYSEKYDVYFHNCTDNNFQTFNCTLGTVYTDDNGNEIYTAKFMNEQYLEKNMYCVATFKKVGNDYKIISCVSDYEKYNN